VQELRIQIDEAKRQREVEEVTETEYFQELRKSAKMLRSKKAGEPPTPINPPGGTDNPGSGS
jgi:hypothetical protein